MAHNDTGERSDKPTAPKLSERITQMFMDPALFISMNTLPKNTAEGVPRPDPDARIFGDDGPSSGLASNFLNQMKGSRFRRDLYHEYRSIEECFPEICAGLDMYADYTVSGGATERSETYEVSTEDGLFKDELEAVEDRIQLKGQAWSIARGMCRDGDEMLELISDVAGLSKVRALPKEEIFRRETSVGNLPIENAFAQIRRNQRVMFDQWQIAHFRLRVNLEDKYGRSILWGARRVARDLMLSEDALSIARLSRSHQRLKYIVDVGEADSAEAKSIIDDFRLVNRRVRTMSQKTGRMNMRNNPLLAEEDIFVPCRTGGKADVGVIPGDNSYTNITDILHKYDRLFSSMKISKAWFGLTGPNIRSVVGEQGLNFMRTVRRIRNDLRLGLSQILMVGLRLKGVPIEKLMDIKLKFKFPMMSHADDELRFKLDKLKLEVAKQYKDLGLMNRFDIMTRIIGIEEDEANKVLAGYDSERGTLPEIFGLNGSAVPAAAAPGGGPGGSQGPQNEASLVSAGISQDDLDRAVQKAIAESPVLADQIASTMELVELLRDSILAA